MSARIVKKQLKTQWIPYNLDFVFIFVAKDMQKKK